MTPTRRRFPFRHVAAGLGLTALVVVALSIDRSSEGSGIEAPAAPSEAARPATAEGTIEPAAAIRRITGPGIPPYGGDGPLLRIAPVEPAPPSSSEIEARRLPPVGMITTATLVAGPIRVHLPGVGEVDPNLVCHDVNGVAWACGRRAVPAIRALVRGRVVVCPMPKGLRRGDVVADCTVGGLDLAERIVASGWAPALDGESRLAEAAARAEARGLGLHATKAPETFDPFPDPDDPPGDATTAPIGASVAAVGAAPPRQAGSE
jgi:endonuclease YncB( thermonuclease family)